MIATLLDFINPLLILLRQATIHNNRLRLPAQVKDGVTGDHQGLDLLPPSRAIRFLIRIQDHHS